MWYRESSRGRNQLCRMFCRLVQGHWFCRGLKFAYPHRNWDCDVVQHITVWTVVQAVLTATFNSYGDRQISTPYKINTLKQSTKIQHSWLRPRGDPVYQIWYKSTHWGLLGKWVTYNKKYFYLYLFSQARAQIRPVDGFLHAIAQKSWNQFKPRKDVPFGGLNDVPLNFGGKTPHKLKFWGVNRTFKPEGWTTKNSNPYNLKTTDPITTKFLQVVRTTSVPSWVVPWLPNKSKMAAAAIFNFGIG